MATKTKIACIEGRFANLVDMRTDGDIFKEEYRSRRAKLEVELESAKAEAEKNTAPIPQKFKRRWKEIEQTLNRLIDLFGDKVSEDVADKFVHRIT